MNSKSRLLRHRRQLTEECSPSLKSPSQPRTHDCNNARQLQLAWAAGFCDGDGCISAVLQRYPDRPPTIRIRLIATQNDHFTLLRLADVLGGRHSLRPVKRQACHNRQAYQLYWDGAHAIAAISLLLPYLVRKRSEAEAALRLFHDGKLSVRTGAAGVSDEAVAARAYWMNRLGRMK